eukprot:TRINITY_DN494_c0_g1_i13.p1 TRINITY_DN494_c0_g1~~TRINITY_DN494_c0_g1_i13.p1  ORF type:complete len:197 (-),score=52.59 TRINITY_DN494_c0_g1_i13:52-642(-)
MIAFVFLLLALTSISAETEKVKASVKSGKTKFSCTFTLANDGTAVVLADSKVVCTPNKPTKRKVKDFKLSTDVANYVVSFNINPEKITKATIEFKEKKLIECAAGFTRVCPSGASGVCPEGMFNFCPYNGSPAAEADTWACSCLQTRMLELDVQAGLNPLGECHGECICLSGNMEAIKNKQKPTFFGPKEMPSYCN